MERFGTGQCTLHVLRGTPSLTTACLLPETQQAAGGNGGGTLQRFIHSGGSRHKQRWGPLGSWEAEVCCVNPAAHKGRAHKATGVH